MAGKAGRVCLIRKVLLSEAKRDFDRDFWQRLGVNKIFGCAWGMVVDAHGLTKAEQRVQRTVVAFRAAPGAVSRHRSVRRHEIH